MNRRRRSSSLAGSWSAKSWVAKSWLKIALLAAIATVQAAAPAAAPTQGQDPAYTVQPGDLLSISVWKEPDLQRPVLVRPDGSFSFPLVGEVNARGKTVADLNK